MEIFSKCYRDVEPKRQTVKSLNDELNHKKAELEKLKAALNEIREMISELDKQHKENQDEMEQLKAEAAVLEVKHQRALKLVDGLSDE